MAFILYVTINRNYGKIDNVILINKIYNLLLNILYFVIENGGKYMSLTDKFLPYKIYKTILDIDFDALKEEGRKYIVFDLDNTIIPYHHDMPRENARILVAKLKKMDFTVLIMSNNHSKRIKKVAKELDVYSISDAMKPLKFGYKKFIKEFHITNLHDVIAIGDQLVTDVFGARRCGIDTIYVNAIDRTSEKWYTRINRKLEWHHIKKFKKKYPDVYNEILKIRGITNA